MRLKQSKRRETRAKWLKRLRSLPCRNCGKIPSGRPRGLCGSCYRSPDIRKRFDSVSKFGRRGVADNYCPVRLPEFPTDAMPGSDRKIDVMRFRAERRESLFHPGDLFMKPRKWEPVRTGRLRGSDPGFLKVMYDESDSDLKRECD